MDDNLYHIGSAAEHTGSYIIDSLEQHKLRREEERARLEGGFTAAPSLEELEKELGEDA